MVCAAFVPLLLNVTPAGDDVVVDHAYVKDDARRFEHDCEHCQPPGSTHPLAAGASKSPAAFLLLFPRDIPQPQALQQRSAKPPA